MTTQEILTILKKHLTEDSGASITWDVLTALRGPDDEHADLKHATTEVVRHVLVGDVGVLTGEFDGQKSWCGFLLSRDSKDSAKFRSGQPVYTHFLGHVSRAFRALGLKWGEVNK